jgi:hypothetical protein
MTDISLNVKLVGASGADNTYQGKNILGGRGATFEFDYTFSTNQQYYFETFEGGDGGIGTVAEGKKGGNAMYLGNKNKSNIGTTNINDVICITGGGGGTSSTKRRGGNAGTVKTINDSNYIGYDGDSGSYHESNNANEGGIIDSLNSPYISGNTQIGNGTDGYNDNNKYGAGGGGAGIFGGGVSINRNNKSNRTGGGGGGASIITKAASNIVVSKTLVSIKDASIELTYGSTTFVSNKDFGRIFISVYDGNAISLMASHAISAYSNSMGEIATTLPRQIKDAGFYLTLSPVYTGFSAFYVVLKAIQTDFSVANTSVEFPYVSPSVTKDMADEFGVSSGQSTGVISYTPANRFSPETVTTLGSTITFNGPATYSTTITHNGDNNYETISQEVTISAVQGIQKQANFEITGTSPNITYGGKGSSINLTVTTSYPYKIYWKVCESPHDTPAHKGGSAVYVGYADPDEFSPEDLLKYSNILAIAGGGGGYGEESFIETDGNGVPVPGLGKSRGNGGDAGVDSQNSHTYLTQNPIESSNPYNVEYYVYPGSAGTTERGNNYYINTYGNMIGLTTGASGGLHYEVSGHHIMDAMTNSSDLELYYYGQGGDSAFLQGGRGSNFEPFKYLTEIGQVLLGGDTVTELSELYSRGGSGGSGFYGGGGGIGVARIQSGGGGGSSLIIAEPSVIIHDIDLSNSLLASLKYDGVEQITAEKLSGSFIVSHPYMSDMSYNHEIEFSTNTFDLASITHTPTGETAPTEYVLYRIYDLIVPESDASYVIHNSTDLSYNSIGKYVVYGSDGSQQITNRSTITVNKAVQPTPLSFVNTSFDFSATLKTVELAVTGGWNPDATVSFEIIGEPSGSFITDNSFTYVNTGSYNIKATRDGGYNYFDISKSEIITIQPGQQELHFQSLFHTEQPSLEYNESNQVDIKTDYLNGPGRPDFSFSFSYYSNDGFIDNSGLFTYTDVSSYPITVTRHVSNFADLSSVLNLSITKAVQPELRFTSTSFNYNRDTKSIDLTKFITGGWSNDADLSFSIEHNGSIHSVFTTTVANPTPYQYNDLSGHFDITVTRDGSQNYIDKDISATIIISDFSVQNKDISYNPDNRTLDLSSTLLLDIGYLTEYDISFTVISAKYLDKTNTTIDPSTYSITDFSFSYIYAGEYDISTTELYHPINNVQSISAKLKIERIPQKFEIKNEDISYSKTNTYDLIQLITEQDETSSEPVHYTINGTGQENNSILQYASKGVYNINISREGNQNYLDTSKNSILSIDKSDLPVPVTFTIGGGTPDGSTSGKGASLSFTVDIIEDVLFYWDISNGGNDNGGGSAVFVGYTVPGSNMDISNILCIVGGGGKGSENGFGGTAGYELIDISSTVDGTRFAVYNGHPGTTNRGNVVASGGNMTDQTFFTDSSSLGGNGYRTGETSNSGGGGGGSTFVNLSKITSYSIGVNDSPIPFLNIKVNNIDDEELDVSGNQSDVKEIKWTPIRFTKPSYDFSYNDVVDLETFIVKYTNYGILSDVSYLDTQVLNTELALIETSILTNANGDNPDVSIDGDNYDPYVVHAKFIDPNDNYNTYSIDASLQIHKAVQPSMEFIDITDVSYDYPSKTLSGTVSGGWSTVADMSYEITATYFNPEYHDVTFQTPVIFTGTNAFDLSYGNAGTYEIIATKDGSRNYVDSSINIIVTVDKNILAIGPDVSFVNISFQYNDPFYNLNFDLSQTQFFGKHEKITKDVSYIIQSQPNVPQNAEINNNTDFSYQYVGQYIIMAGIFDDPNYQDISTTFTIDILKANQPTFSFYNTDTDTVFTSSTNSEYTKESKSLSFTVSGGWSQEADVSFIIEYEERIERYSSIMYPTSVTGINTVNFDYIDVGDYEIIATRDGSWNFLDISTVHTHIVDRTLQDLSFNDLSFSYNETPYHLQFDLSTQAIDYYEHDSKKDVSYEITSQPNGLPANAQIVDDSKFSYHYVGDYILKASVIDAINYFDVSTTFSIDISKAYQTRDFSFVFQSFTIEDSELLVTDETDVSTVYNPLDKKIDFTVSGGWSQNADISCEIQYTHHTDITISNEVHRDDITIFYTSDVQFNYTNAGDYEISVTRDGSWNYFDLTISTEFVVNRAVQELSFNDISFSYKYDNTLIYDLSQGIDHEEPHCDGNIMYSIETQPTVPTNAIVRVNTSIFDYSYAGVYEILAEKDGSTNYYDISHTFLIEVEKANQLSHFPELSFNNTFETEISYNPIDKDISFTVQGGFPIGDLTCEIQYNNNSDVFVENVSQSNILIKSLTDVSFAYINTGFYDVTITRDGSWNYHDLSISETVQIQKINQEFYFDMDTRHFYYDTNKEVALVVSADLPTADISFVLQSSPSDISSLLSPKISDSSLNYGKYGNYLVVSNSKDLSDNYYDASDSILLDIRREATTFDISNHDMSFVYLQAFDLSSLISGVESTGEITYTVSSGTVFLGDFSENTDRYFHYDNRGIYYVTANVSGDEQYFETSDNSILIISPSLQTDFCFNNIEFEYNKSSQTFDLRTITFGGYANGIATYDFSGDSSMNIIGNILQYNDLSYADVSQCIIILEKSGVNNKYLPDYTFQNYFDISDTAVINISKIFQTFIMRNTTITTPVLIDFTDSLYLQDTNGNPIVKDSQELYIKYPNSDGFSPRPNFLQYLPFGVSVVRVEQPGDDIHIRATSGNILFTVQDPQSFDGLQFQEFKRRIESIQSRSEAYAEVVNAFSGTSYTIVRNLPYFPFFTQYERRTTIAEQSTVIMRTQYESIYALIPNKDDFVSIPVANSLNLIIKRTTTSDDYVLYLSDYSFSKSFTSGHTFVFSEYYFIFNNGVFFERVPVLSSCCPPVIPIVVSNISQKQEYAHYVRNTRYRKVFQGRARNVVVSDISYDSFTVNFETIGDPKEYIFTIIDANKVETKYTVNAEVHGTSYTFMNLNSNETYLIDVKIKYITVKPYSLESVISVRTLSLINDVFITPKVESMDVQIIANNYDEYDYEVEYSLPNQNPLYSDETTESSNTIVISGLIQDTGYLIKVNVYKDNILQVRAGTERQVVRTLPIISSIVLPTNPTIDNGFTVNFVLNLHSNDILYYDYRILLTDSVTNQIYYEDLCKNTLKTSTNTEDFNYPISHISGRGYYLEFISYTSIVSYTSERVFVQHNGLLENVPSETPIQNLQLNGFQLEFDIENRFYSFDILITKELEQRIIIVIIDIEENTIENGHNTIYLTEDDLDSATEMQIRLYEYGSSIPLPLLGSEILNLVSS